MKKWLITVLVLTNTIIAQVTLSDINKLGNTQLDLIREELNPTSDSNSVTVIEEEIYNETSKDNLVQIEGSDELDPIYFGYNFFNKNINFFDNIPTPSNYKLGPGDEIILSLWGKTNLRKSLTISNEGLIYYENLGFISLSNLTLQEAELVLKNELSKIYSTLTDNKDQTDLMLELGSLKSINVYFTGQVDSPGIHIIHPFSNIMTAIVQAGGIKKEGSLRKIQLIRNNKVIETIDFYNFFIRGVNNFSDIKIIDGDVIYIPVLKNRIEVSGEISRPGYYEVLNDENIADLIHFSAGFTAYASSTLILTQIIPIEERFSDDNAKTSTIINFNNKESITLNNGDTINVPTIPTVDLEVTVYGRVKSPGTYPGINTSLKNILDIAGGFDDPIFRQTIREDEIIILRQDRNQFYSKELKVSYQDADQFKLETNDKIFIYENINYRNSFTYRIEGEVYKPGTYPINSNKITVGEALALAGGLTELSSERNLSVKQEFTSLDDVGNEIITSETVNNISLDFEIGINSVIIASPFENVVRVEGNVYNPGLVTFTKGYKYPRYIELAGGYKSDTLKNKTYIKRANGNIEKVNGYFISRGKNVYPGDTIVVPANPNPGNFDITSFISDLSTTLANIAAILLIVDSNNK